MNNPNDDLDDQLYILLASMKEYREAIGDDKKRLETFYNQVASGVLDKAEKSLENANKKHTELKIYHHFCQYVCSLGDGVLFGDILICTKQR